MTKLEMDDVLASIRKLVSDARPESPKSQPANVDRFVLTPAHRIFDDAADASAEGTGDGDTLQLTPQAEVDLPPEPEDAPEEDAPEEEHRLPFHETEAEAITGAWGSEDFGKAQSPRTTLEQRIAELEAAVSQSQEEWEPDGSEPDAGVMPERHIFTVVETHREDSQPAPAEPEAEDPTVDAAEDDDAAASVAFVHEAPFQLTPDAMFAHRPRAPQATEPPAEGTGPAADVQPPEPTVAAEVISGDSDIFVDEDVLRRIVSEVVRDELQGKLGEKMTRNIRRMVRREIEQTLTLKKLD